ncbi:MAG: NAD-dependent epimerase/dehydratase family protein [Clostridia bacterium]|nr:NAD-dependent epimerase/dehydratase family protein [Clostridia bacterium]
MKKILITGANSYIGTSFEKYIKENYPDAYVMDTVDMVDGTWREKSFAGYDSVFHVAGIAHQKETKKNAPLYYNVNRDLAIETAEKAKVDGVKHFIFLSSMSIYGMDTGVITKETKPSPKSHYGKSKWQAEQGIAELEDENFKVCILRPPMVYGKGCKGNFQTVVKIVKISPIFPKVKNERSMIYIDNLSSFVKMCIDNGLNGLYFLQNREYVSTVDLANGISASLGKKIYFEYLTGIGVKILRLFHPTVQKAFGSLIYDMENDRNNDVVSKMESIRRSVD